MSQWHLNHGIRAIVSMRPTNPRLLLLEVAEREFAAVGFEGTTVRAIARLAGVRDHVVYNLFGSKAGLMKEVESARSNGAGAAAKSAQAAS
jgi:AcrR family transcriptional regulator